MMPKAWYGSDSIWLVLSVLPATCTEAGIRLAQEYAITANCRKLDPTNQRKAAIG